MVRVLQAGWRASLLLNVIVNSVNGGEAARALLYSQCKERVLTRSDNMYDKVFEKTDSLIKPMNKWMTLNVELFDAFREKQSGLV
ncbi:MAG: hypothetical protein ACI9Y1_001830, partial [Lentisphaeria bacterium]